MKLLNRVKAWLVKPNTPKEWIMGLVIMLVLMTASAAWATCLAVQFKGQAASLREEVARLQSQHQYAAKRIQFENQWRHHATN